MKVFDLACADGHRFEGWFASLDRYAEQLAAQGIRCPLCDSTAIRREPSAPRLNFGSAGDGSAPIRPADESTQDAARARATVPDASDGRGTVLGQLRRLVASTEDVGARFAEEARRIHYDETPARPIRGTATDRERRDLHDEGIETLSIPVPRALTETLQ